MLNVVLFVVCDTHGNLRWIYDLKSVYFVIGILLFPIWFYKLILFNKKIKGCFTRMLFYNFQ